MHKGIYKDNNTWYIHTTIKGKSVTIRGFSSKKDAEENYEVAIEKWKRDHNVISDNYFRSVANEFLEYRSKLVRPESLRKDKTQLKYFDVLFANDTIRNIFNITRLRIIYNDIVTADDLSSQKKMRLVLVFRDFAKYCNQTNRISDSIYKEFLLVFLPVKENKRDRKERRTISTTQINAILSDINKNNDNLFYLAVSVLYSCGLRISELLGLIGSDIDLENKKTKVQRQLLTSGELTTLLKTSNSYREVPISSDLFKLFEVIRLSNERVFPYSHTTFKRKLKQYTDYTAHEFRHTRCFELAKKCENMSDVVYCAKVMGHTTSTYLNTYCNHLDNKLDNKFF